MEDVAESGMARRGEERRGEEPSTQSTSAQSHHGLGAQPADGELERVLHHKVRLSIVKLSRKACEGESEKHIFTHTSYTHTHTHTKVCDFDDVVCGKKAVSGGNIEVDELLRGDVLEATRRIDCKLELLGRPQGDGLLATRLQKRFVRDGTHRKK
jgi:hypothetical protein